MQAFAAGLCITRYSLLKRAEALHHDHNTKPLSTLCDHLDIYDCETRWKGSGNAGVARCTGLHTYHAGKAHILLSQVVSIQGNGRRQSSHSKIKLAFSGPDMLQGASSLLLIASEAL